MIFRWIFKTVLLWILGRIFGRVFPLLRRGLAIFR